LLQLKQCNAFVYTVSAAPITIADVITQVLCLHIPISFFGFFWFFLLMHMSFDAVLLYAQVEREWQQLVADAAKGDLGPCADKVYQ
jgi:hypothetical protein